MTEELSMKRWHSLQSIVTSVAIAYNAARNGTDDVEAEAVDMSSCASCGIAAIDDIKLMPCDGCDLVRYCSDECQREHKAEHEAKCKERAAELRDEILFRQPESTHLGDCPICCLPLPLDRDEYILQPCCSKIICAGCVMAESRRQWEENKQHPTCPFCRHPVPKQEEERDKIEMKRVQANDPVALCQVADRYYHNGDYVGAIKYWKRAAKLGDAGAHHSLSVLYRKGKDVKKDEKKALFHLEEAAIRGHPKARYDIGCIEGGNVGRIERAVKHWIIAANLGDKSAIKALKLYYKHGSVTVSKDDFAAALRAHQAAVDATKSPQREAAAKVMRQERAEGKQDNELI